MAGARRPCSRGTGTAKRRRVAAGSRAPGSWELERPLKPRLGRGRKRAAPEVGGGGGSRCAREGGRRCERARPLLFLSPAATSAAEPLEGEARRLPARSPASPGRWDAFSGRWPARAVTATSRCRCLGAAPVGLRSSPGAFGPGVAGGCRLPSSSVTPRFRGSPNALQLPGAGSGEEGARIAAFAPARAPSSPGPAAATGAAGRAGPRWSRELAPSPRPPKFASLPFRGGGSAPRGGRCLGLQLGVWRPPGFGQVCWRHNEWDPGTARKSSFSERGATLEGPAQQCAAGRGEPARVQAGAKLSGGELSASHFLPKGRNCRADHETKRIETIWPGTHVQKCILVTGFRAQ